MGDSLRVVQDVGGWSTLPMLERYAHPSGAGRRASVRPADHQISTAADHACYSGVMPTPFESALLNLKLFELRREPALREAREWFVGTFNPMTFDEFVEVVSGERNASFRMVLGYWDMACSLVTSGAIDRDAFLAAHGEVVATYAKVHPFLKQLREQSGPPEAFAHLEAVVLAIPDAETKLRRLLEGIRAAANRPRTSARVARD